jgi:hypothetical protein
MPRQFSTMVASILEGDPKPLSFVRLSLGRNNVFELLIRLATILPLAKGRGEPSSSAPCGCLYQPCPGRARAMT